MEACNLCPRGCSVDRSTGQGYCKSGTLAKVARAAPHFWEEPCISGKNGSGAVFFSGCSLGCVYCQNKKISRGGFGKDLTASELRAVFEGLCAQGVHNINLVTPTHFVPQIKAALTPRLPVPVIYNCGGYESLKTLDSLYGLVDIFMPDMKYSIPTVGLKYSGVADYPEINLRAVHHMYSMVGDVEYGADGLLKKGVIARHLILPGNIINTKGVIRSFAMLCEGKKLLFSLMAQYTPAFAPSKFPELMRKVSPYELHSAQKYLEKYPQIEGYFQSLSSSGEDCVPDFNLSGL